VKIKKISTVFVLSLVFSVALGAIAQTRIIDPTRFNAVIDAFESADSVNMPPLGAILVTGSSSIRGWHSTIKEDLSPLTVIPRGFGGSTMFDLLHFLDRIVLRYKPRAVVIYEGDNDTGAFGVSPAQIAEETKQVISKIHKLLPQTRIYLISVKPSLARVAFWDKAQETNHLFKKISASSNKISYIDIAAALLRADGNVMEDIFLADNLHLNEKGMRIWVETIKEVLMIAEAQYE